MASKLWRISEAISVRWGLVAAFVCREPRDSAGLMRCTRQHSQQTVSSVVSIDRQRRQDKALGAKLRVSPANSRPQRAQGAKSDQNSFITDRRQRN